MKKYCLDLTVSQTEKLSSRHVLLKLTQKQPLPEMLPGQFVELRVDNGGTTFLRRPISINYVDRENNEMWLLIAAVGAGTRHLCSLNKGDTLNCLFPLGNGFSMPDENNGNVLLVGGGVGVAPLLFQGRELKAAGYHPVFLLGARTKTDLLELAYFQEVGEVFVTTEDGSFGERGFVTDHSILFKRHFDLIQTCGPKPMMVNVAKYARKQHIDCEASLENMMACGLGACLCCVEKTTNGNLCVCKEGPVFNIKDLLW
ncbi:MAG: dihydroorotate dehydrogenase electron transfer subunit [Prevotella sp.]|jgi:dihydroorotate dehydrogenase electron transfer subunit